MKALVFDIRVNSLYSVRIPFTWQSALTYPVLPPSAIIGMLANALQRYKNDKHPLEYLDQIESDLIWVGSRLLTPCVIKSYTTSAIVKWQVRVGDKSTNALGRQFAYTRNLQIAAIFRTLPEDLPVALISVPLTAGDSESAISIENNPKLTEAREVARNEVTTYFPVIFKNSILRGGGRIYLMHEICRRRANNLPLFTYICPIEEKNGIIYPSEITIKCPPGEKVYEIEGIGEVVSKQ